MLPDEFNNRNKLDKKYYYSLINEPEYETETNAQKHIRLLHERKQTFKKNLKSFIGGH